MIDSRTPHIEPDWAEQLLLELRLRAVAGTTIGAVLAEVESHCADSGETARDAFGDPVEYAAALDLPASPTQGGSSAPHVAAAGAGLLGMFTTAGAVAAWQTQTTVTLTLGALLASFVVLACFAGLALRTDKALRLVVERPLVTALGFGVVTGALVVLLVSARQPVADLPWQPLLVLGLTLVGGEVLWTVRHRDQLDDPVQGPTPGGAGTVLPGRLPRLATAIGPWLTPVLTAALSLPWFFV